MYVRFMSVRYFVCEFRRGILSSGSVMSFVSVCECYDFDVCECV